MWVSRTVEPTLGPWDALRIGIHNPKAWVTKLNVGWIPLFHTSAANTANKHHHDTPNSDTIQAGKLFCRHLSPTTSTSRTLRGIFSSVRSRLSAFGAKVEPLLTCENPLNGSLSARQQPEVMTCLYAASCRIQELETLRSRYLGTSNAEL
jgi:hypothetical protein